jgi:hypothetical protein
VGVWIVRGQKGVFGLLEIVMKVLLDQKVEHAKVESAFRTLGVELRHARGKK